MSVLDVEKFWTNYGEIKEVLPSLVDQFRKSSPERVKKIEEALAAGDYEALRSSAHRLKGLLIQLYATDSSSVALQLEQMGKSKNLEGSTALLQKLVSEIKLLESALTDQLSKP